jgi:hypothetical protein
MSLQFDNKISTGHLLTVATPGVAGQRGVGTDGKLYVHTGTAWFAFMGTEVV